PGPVHRPCAAAGGPRSARRLPGPLHAGRRAVSDLTDLLPHTGSLIRRAQQRHAAQWARLVSSTITSVQFAALAVLADTPGASQRQLGDALEIDRSTVADLAARLERHGLVAREQDAADRRRYVLRLTPVGRAELA